MVKRATDAQWLLYRQLYESGEYTAEEAHKRSLEDPAMPQIALTYYKVAPYSKKWKSPRKKKKNIHKAILEVENKKIQKAARAYVDKQSQIEGIFKELEMDLEKRLMAVVSGIQCGEDATKALTDAISKDGITLETVNLVKGYLKDKETTRKYLQMAFELTGDYAAKKIEAKTSPLKDLSDDELDARIRDLKSE